MELDPIQVFRSATSHLIGKMVAAWICCASGAALPELINDIGRAVFEHARMAPDHLGNAFFNTPLYLFLNLGNYTWWTTIGVLAVCAIPFVLLLYIRESDLEQPLGWMLFLSMLCTMQTSGDYLVFSVIVAGFFFYRLAKTAWQQPTANPKTQS